MTFLIVKFYHDIDLSSIRNEKIFFSLHQIMHHHMQVANASEQKKKKNRKKIQLLFFFFFICLLSNSFEFVSTISFAPKFMQFKKKKKNPLE
ncbi:hypothetical protein BG74_06580 [Sodalis-like endosymbiont of Proechinophthirus fluctus]|nr:hypothetical protein BG74_06580 [Sodalis-like endosymbiont of Proechinophthirus fluctus]